MFQLFEDSFHLRAHKRPESGLKDFEHRSLPAHVPANSPAPRRASPPRTPSVLKTTQWSTQFAGATEVRLGTVLHLTRQNSGSERVPQNAESAGKGNSEFQDRAP